MKPPTDAEVSAFATELLLELEASHVDCPNAGQCATTIVIALLKGEATSFQQMQAALVIEKLERDMALSATDGEIARGLILLISRPDKTKAGH